MSFYNKIETKYFWYHSSQKIFLFTKLRQIQSYLGNINSGFAKGCPLSFSSSFPWKRTCTARLFRDIERLFYISPETCDETGIVAYRTLDRWGHAEVSQWRSHLCLSLSTSPLWANQTIFRTLFMANGKAVHGNFSPSHSIRQNRSSFQDNANGGWRDKLLMPEEQFRKEERKNGWMERNTGKLKLLFLEIQKVNRILFPKKPS